MYTKKNTVKSDLNSNEVLLEPSLEIHSEQCSPRHIHLQFSTIFEEGDIPRLRPISPIPCQTKSVEKLPLASTSKYYSPNQSSTQAEPKVEYSNLSKSLKSLGNLLTPRTYKLPNLDSHLRSPTKKRSLQQDFRKLECIGFQDRSKTSLQLKGFLAKSPSSSVKLADLWGSKQSLQVIRSANLTEAARKLKKIEKCKELVYNRMAISPRDLDRITYHKLLNKKLSLSPPKEFNLKLPRKPNQSNFEVLLSPHKRKKELTAIHKIITSCDQLFHESRNMQSILYNSKKHQLRT
jgi:hypothetical protein